MINVNDNIKVNAGKPLDAKYLSGVTPYANVAAAVAAIPLAERSLGLTVLIGSVEYWWQNGLTDLDLIVKSGSGGITLPKERTVYLIQDATYAAAAGISNNVYTTFTNAYNAANTLQTTLGGSNVVYLKVIGIIPGGSNALTLTADFNPFIRLIGETPSSSQVGNITLTNATGNGYSFGSILSVFISNISIGNISCNATGTTGNAGTINIVLDNCKLGNLLAYPSNVANTTGNAGNITVNSVTAAACIIGTVGNNLVAPGSSGTSGSLTITALGRLRTSAIRSALTQYLGASGGSLTLKNVDTTSSILRYSSQDVSIINCSTTQDIIINDATVSLVGPMTVLIQNTYTQGGIAVQSDPLAQPPIAFLNNCQTTGVILYGVIAHLTHVISQNPLGYGLEIVDCITVYNTQCKFDTIDYQAGFSASFPPASITDGLGVLQLFFLQCGLYGAPGGSQSVIANSIPVTILTAGTFYEASVDPLITLNVLTLDT